jgi:hypothetical protein
MRCHICDRLLDEPKLNPEIGEFDPCPTCMAVVEDTLASYTEKPAASETDLGIDPLWDEMFPPMYDPFEEMS